MKTFFYTILLVLGTVSMPNFALAQIQDNAIDDTGDIAFVAYTTGPSNGISGFAFVLLDNCPANTAIYFTDEEWTNAPAFGTGEGDIVWTNNTGATIAKGTVIKIAGPVSTFVIGWTIGSGNVNIGGATISNAFSTANGDQIFAMTAMRSGTHLAFVGDIAATGLSLNGTPYGSGTAPSASLTAYGVNIPTLSGGRKYSGSTVCNGTITACQTMVNTAGSWNATGFTGLTTAAAFFAAIPNFFTGSVLPIELISFTGKNEEAQNLLSWKTATETNNKGFEIETCKDGVNFQVIEFVKGRGTTSETQNYTFTHRLATKESGILYYRLKQMDYDGQFEYSQTIAIRSEGKQNSIAVYPNPSNGLYTISLDEKAEIEQISLMTVTGQSIDVNISNNQLDLTNEAAGVYFLQVNGENIRLIKN